MWIETLLASKTPSAQRRPSHHCGDLMQAPVSGVRENPAEHPECQVALS